MSGLTDPIADMITRIRNGGMARHSNVVIPASNMKLALARVLKEEGFIREWESVGNPPQRSLRVHLLYDEYKTPLIKGIQRASKPGRRFYVSKDDIPRVYGGLGVSILTTPQGLMTGRRAKQQGVGGEVICYIW